LCPWICGFAAAIDGETAFVYAIHMKRTNLVLDETLLEEAVRVAGTKTYSGAVDLALRDFVRRAKARRILELTGSGLWEGNLARMRRDQSRGRNH
jgi:Arc/MetJ family transcription regulator